MKYSSSFMKSSTKERYKTKKHQDQNTKATMFSKLSYEIEKLDSLET
jgi:hypothetical protein